MTVGWLRQRERGSRIAERFMIWVAVSVGRPAARALLYPICAYYVLCSRHASRAIQPYLIRALGRPTGWRDLYRQFHCFASTLLDRVYLLTGQAGHFDIEIWGLDVLKNLSLIHI